MKAMLTAGALAVAGVLTFSASIVAADRAFSDDKQATEATAVSSPRGDTSAAAGTEARGVQSYAGASVPNADELAAARAPYPAELPPVPAGDIVRVHMVLKDVTIEIAPGVKYNAWGFEGGAPGPVVDARQGDHGVFSVAQCRTKLAGTGRPARAPGLGPARRVLLRSDRGHRGADAPLAR